MGSLLRMVTRVLRRRVDSRGRRAGSRGRRGGGRRGLGEDWHPELRPELRAFAYEQADLYRDGIVTRKAAVAAIRERFPEVSAGQADDAFAQGLHDSR